MNFSIISAYKTVKCIGQMCLLVKPSCDMIHLVTNLIIQTLI